MKKLVVAIVVLILGGAGYIAYGKHKQTLFIESLTPHVKNASLRVVNSVRFDADGSNMTFKEIFEKLEADIAEIDKRLLDVQSLSSAATSSFTDPTIEYLRATQDYLRALLQKFRKKLDRVSTLTRMTDAVTALSSSPYGYDIAHRLYEQAESNYKEAEQEYNASLPELLDAVAQLKETRTRVKPLFAEDALIAEKELEEVVKKNSPESKPPNNTTESK
jgi:ABC-type transporter Mla subunit MlaD